MKRKRARLTVADLGCRFLLNPCTGTLLRPLLGSAFEPVENTALPDGAMPLAAFARRHGLKSKTLHNRIWLGELRPEHGLEKRRGRWWVIDALRFARALKGCEGDCPEK
jgi:hypothetical protein